MKYSGFKEGGENMNLKARDIITFHHYSSEQPFIGIVLETSNDVLLVRLANLFDVTNFSEGEPISISILLDNNVYIASCTVTKIKAASGSVEIKIDDIDCYENRRSFTRFPVSLSANVKGKDSGEWHQAIVKNISEEGLMISSKSYFGIGQNVIVSIDFIERNMDLIANIRRNQLSRNDFLEYGLKIIEIADEDKNYLKKFISELAKEMEEEIRKLSETE